MTAARSKTTYHLTVRKGGSPPLKVRDPQPAGVNPPSGLSDRTADSGNTDANAGNAGALACKRSAFEDADDAATETSRESAKQNRSHAGGTGVAGGGACAPVEMALLQESRSLRPRRSAILSHVIEAVTAQDEDAKNQARWAAIQRKVQAGRVVRIFKLFRDNNIEPVLIKGFAADRFYPQDVFRDSIDVDLAVSRDEFERANTLISSKEADGLAIDLHNELRHLDTADWPDLFENTRLIDVENTTVRVLRPEDHLRVLAVHWLNDGGINKQKLWDIYYLMTNRADDFDWDRALNTVNERRKRWIICTILLANKYLGLDLANTPLANETLPNWLTRTVEHEWDHHQTEVPLWLLTKKPGEFLKQLGLRINPNPIRATIEMEGDIDAKTRIFYKAGNLFQRLIPSIRRNVRSATDK